MASYDQIFRLPDARTVRACFTTGWHPPVADAWVAGLPRYEPVPKLRSRHGTISQQVFQLSDQLFEMTRMNDAIVARVNIADIQPVDPPSPAEIR